MLPGAVKASMQAPSGRRIVHRRLMPWFGLVLFLMGLVAAYVLGMPAAAAGEALRAHALLALVATLVVGLYAGTFILLRRAVEEGDDRCRALREQALGGMAGLGNGHHAPLNEQEAMEAIGDRLRQRAPQERSAQVCIAELRQQQRYLRTLLDMVPMWAWLKDTESRYLAVNQAAAKACGLTVAQMIGKTDDELWSPALAQAYREDDLQVMASRDCRMREEALRTGNTTVWLETHKAAMVDEDGTVLGTLGVARDVSERKASEAAGEAALAEATDLAKERTRFLAQMSHELRTPLNGILGFAQLLLRDKSLDERHARQLRTIEESGQHLLMLITDILDIARIDAARLELFPGEVHLPMLLQLVSDNVRVKAEEKDLEYHYWPDALLPEMVWLDERRLRQVLLNLLSNAVRFTDRGRVELHVRALPVTGSGTSPVEGMEAMARLRFEGHDSGIGIEASEMGRLFRPFEQVAAEGHREGGAGLGLAISGELVRLMGGTIDVRSEPGRGSVFSFELEVPAAQAPAALAPCADHALRCDGPRRRVLVADDVSANRDMLVDTLSAMGFDVHAASDGRMALEQIRALPPDLVIMDVAMPVMSGLQAMRHMRADPRLSQVPVIATSASASREVEARCDEAGASAFIAKPIEYRALLDAMGRLMQVSWVQDDTAPHPTRPDETDIEGLVLPPAEEIAVLRRLARIGNMRTIEERAAHLRRMDTRYEAFAARLETLAQRCRSRAITTMVERCSAEAGAPRHAG